MESSIDQLQNEINSVESDLKKKNDLLNRYFEIFLNHFFKKYPKLTISHESEFSLKIINKWLEQNNSNSGL